MDNMIIIGKDCEPCIHSSIDDSDRSKIIVKCDIKEREYIWGMCIPCEYREVNKSDRTKEM